MTVARKEMHNSVDAFIWQLHSFELLEEVSSKRPARIALCLFHRRYQAHERFAETARTDLSYLALPSFLVFRLLPYGLSVMRRSIREPLANDALHCPSGAFYVIYAEPNAV